MEDSLRFLLEKDRIIDTINSLFIFTDNRDWKAAENCFADKVHFDMTSMGAEKVEVLEPKQITQMWEEGLGSLEAIHHQAGNYKVEIRENKAIAYCYGIASHFKKTVSGKNTRTFVGSYSFHLQKDKDKWKIDSFKFNMKYVDGNVDLV